MTAFSPPPERVLVNFVLNGREEDQIEERYISKEFLYSDSLWIKLPGMNALPIIIGLLVIHSSPFQ